MAIVKARAFALTGRPVGSTAHTSEAVAVSRQMFQEILSLIARLRAPQRQQRCAIMKAAQ